MPRNPLIGFIGTAALCLTAGAAWSQPLTIWWNKGYYPEEDQRFEEIVAKWEQETGNEAELSFYVTEDLPRKVVAALDAGNPPDLAFGHLFDFAYNPRWAYEGKLEDVSDVVESVKDDLTETAVEAVYLLNGQTGERAYYAMPTQQQTAHIHYWKDMVEEAGFTEADIPKDWEGFWDFWCSKVQPALREKGKRVYGVGHTLSSASSDTFFHFNMFLNAYGVKFMDEDGNLLVDDPEVREGIIAAMDEFTRPYRDGCTPPGSVNWQDPDNNVNFLNRITVMTPNPTLSVPASQKNTNPEAYNETMRTMEWPDGPGGRKIVYMTAIKTAVIFADSENKDLAKDFMRFLYKPENLGPYIQGSLGRWYPVNKSLMTDPFWEGTDDPHRAAAHRQYQERDTIPFQMVYNWKYTQLQAENVWGQAIGRIVLEGESVEESVDKMIARMKEVLGS